MLKFQISPITHNWGHWEISRSICSSVHILNCACLGLVYSISLVISNVKAISCKVLLGVPGWARVVIEAANQRTDFVGAPRTPDGSVPFTPPELALQPYTPDSDSGSCGPVSFTPPDPAPEPHTLDSDFGSCSPFSPLEPVPVRPDPRTSVPVTPVPGAPIPPGSPAAPAHPVGPVPALPDVMPRSPRPLPAPPWWLYRPLRGNPSWILKAKTEILALSPRGRLHVHTHHPSGSLLFFEHSIGLARQDQLRHSVLHLEHGPHTWRPALRRFLQTTTVQWCEPDLDEIMSYSDIFLIERVLTWAGRMNWFHESGTDRLHESYSFLQNIRLAALLLRLRNLQAGTSR